MTEEQVKALIAETVGKIVEALRASGIDLAVVEKIAKAIE